MTNADILPSVTSDHSAIELSLKIDGPERGPGFGKLNTGILNEPESKNGMRILINEIWSASLQISDVCSRFDKEKKKREKCLFNEIIFYMKKYAKRQQRIKRRAGNDRRGKGKRGLD